MKLRNYFPFFIFITILVMSTSYSQEFNEKWLCNYATYDNETNGAGYPVISVGVIKENTFVALIYRESPNASYIVGYTNADSANGRMGTYPYGGANADFHQPWTYGFDQIDLNEAYDMAVTKDSLIYVANNDGTHNILVFRMTADSIESTEYRMSTGTDGIWAVAVDKQGYVYVSRNGDSLTAGAVLVYKGIKQDNNWGISHTSSPIITIPMPEPGNIRGITVNNEGTLMYVSNYTSKNVYCYAGDPVNGYTKQAGFNFKLNDMPIASDSTVLNPGPWGVKFLETKNLLFVACDVSFMKTIGYEYGRIYILNPNTGATLDTIDCAKWNYDHIGSYDSRPNGTAPGNASGFTATYDMDFDENFSLYATAYWGWSVDKWVYQGSLPVIPLNIVSVEKVQNQLPKDFEIYQNYPNPFNPVTTIEFSVSQPSAIMISIYTITGELVANLINQRRFDTGRYKVTFDATALASGTYIYTIKNSRQTLSKKMVLLK